MRELADFSSHDGHIESIVIGAEQVKVSFQTWNCMELVLIFDSVIEVFSTATMTDRRPFELWEPARYSGRGRHSRRGQALRTVTDF